MKITLKTLKGHQLPIEVTPDMTVAALKAHIETTHGQNAATQKLIAYGKVMDDDAKTVADYKINEGGFIVMMVAKAKPVKPAAQEDAKQEEVAQPGVTLPAADQSAQASASATASNPPAQQPQPSAQPTTEAQADSSSGAGGALPPGITEEALSTLFAITNKPREQCIQALTLARGDADLACSLLLEGIDLNQIPAGGDPGYADYGDEDAGMGQPGGQGGGGAGMPPGAELMALMQNPQFANMAQRMRENPQFYQQFMARLEQDNPQIYQAIQQNPMAFMNMIMGGNPNLGGGMGGGMPPGMGGGQMPPGMGGPPQARPGPRPGQIQVTPAEMQAIQRLEGLGFPRHKCLEAYLACDKNEELAANFLFENAMDDDQAMMDQAIADSQANAAGANAEAQPQPEAQAQPQPAEAQPAAEQQQQPAQAEPAAADQQQQPPAENAQPDSSNAAGANNNNGGGDGNANGGGDGAAGAGDGGEKSAFE